MQTDQPISTTLLSFKAYWAAAVCFSAAANLLLLVTPIYMLQIYDRVLTSGSFDTLILISLMAAVLLFVFAAAETGRRRVFAMIGRALGDQLNTPLFHAGLKTRGASLEDAAGRLARLQGFFVNGQVAPLFDAPFTPFFILVIFFIHPVLGALGLAGVMLLLWLAVVTELSAHGRQQRAQKRERLANAFLSGSARQSSAIISMGMASKIETRWRRLRAAAMNATLASTARTAFLSSLTKSVRQILQVASLGLGAVLVLNQQISAGAIIAASIILGRALAPIDQIVASWRQIVDVRTSWRALSKQLRAAPAQPDQVTAPPRPAPSLSFEKLAIAPPRAEEALVSLPDLTLQRGEMLFVAGPSGGGKTSLLQTLAGVRKPFSGASRLGGRSIHDWAPEDRGLHVGYLPQNVELLPGSVIENIARFADDAPDKAFEAASTAGCDKIILGLADGYDTIIGAGGAYLSAGQRQLIGIARAVYGDPALVLLDEPTANADARAVNAVAKLLDALKRKDAVIVVASHDLRLLPVATHVLTLQAGKAALSTQTEYAEHLARAAKAVNLERLAG